VEGFGNIRSSKFKGDTSFLDRKSTDMGEIYQDRVSEPLRERILLSTFPGPSTWDSNAGELERNRSW
jgi:hypothetical protein